MNIDEKEVLLEKVRTINQLHKRLKREQKTDLILRSEIKSKLDEIQFLLELRPIEMNKGLFFDNEDYLESYTKHEDLQCKKYFAARDGDFEKAAQFRDKARVLMDSALDKVLLETYPNQGPFFIINDWVYYHKVDSRVLEML